MLRMKRMCYISKYECGQFILLLSCFLCCVPFSQKRWRDGDHCGHIFQHWLYLKELHFRRYRVWIPTLRQRTPAWGTKNKHPTPKYTQVRSCTHTRHPLSPSVHCNYKLSSGGESHSSDTESKPLAKKKKKWTQRLPTPFSFQRRGVEMGVEVTGRRATTLPNSKGPTSTTQVWMTALWAVQCPVAQLLAAALRGVPTSNYEQKRNSTPCSTSCPHFWGCLWNITVGSGRGAGFKRQGYIFALAMRWMTGGELAASAWPHLVYLSQEAPQT